MRCIGLRAKESLNYADYLLKLVELELIERETRAAQRRMAAAKFPIIKSVDPFDFSEQPTINQPLIGQLLQGEYMSKKENILFICSPGTGKTHLSTSLGVKACQQWQNSVFQCNGSGYAANRNA